MLSVDRQIIIEENATAWMGIVEILSCDVIVQSASPTRIVRMIWPVKTRNVKILVIVESVPIVVCTIIVAFANAHLDTLAMLTNCAQEVN